MSWDRSYTRKVISVRCASTYISVLIYLWVLVGVLEVMFLWLDLGNDSDYLWICSTERQHFYCIFFMGSSFSRAVSFQDKL